MRSHNRRGWFSKLALSPAQNPSGAAINMRSAGNFHPEWGYFAPMPSFRRAARIAVVATAIGATAGLVVGVSLLGPSRSHVYNMSMPGHELVVIPSQAETLATTNAASAQPASAVLALQRPDGDTLIEMPQAADASRASPTAAAASGPDTMPARKRPVRVHRLRIATGPKHPRYASGLAQSFQLPRNSMFVQLDQRCCAWTAPPVQRNATQW